MRFIINCCCMLMLFFCGFANAEQSSKPMPAPSHASVEVVNINAADINQLETLRGVGTAKAQAILDYRTQHGAFKSIEELAQVKGIGEKRLAQLQKSNPGRMVVQ